ncbi:glycoside hydrolase [Gloeophyllum trabeum ATCC 11539]|uniref:Beta-mannosidase B n=1 Tax=Gloeophyllum trabeum (strain ATCC 11539 / FP-39264 / Madison 617) TaxID=670483 RepID=S7Q613_GLOTA|nr:glycoside hydrolase [Gloeophyllum trabeum ATCC 11539]EPQ54903.1 glycoside hydrolase [Gloeophyllum trabeum ATCC 11539]
MATRVKQISSDWQWKERDTTTDPVTHELAAKDFPSGPDKFDTRAAWRSATQFPSEVHVELIQLGRIPHPYIGFNEHNVQWVGEREWLYRNTFAIEARDRNEYAELFFEGLDTFCDVYVNEELVLSTDNQFRTYRVPLSSRQLATSNEVTLLLHFKSAKLIAKQLEAKYGRVRAGSTNLGDPSRVYVRKAQYDWRWDWGPELLTCGPYRPISLITYKTRIADLNTHAVVAAPPQLLPSFSLDIRLSGDISATDRVRVTLKDTTTEKEIRSEETVINGLQVIDGQASDVVKWSFQAKDVELWWPVGYGKQKLYTVEVLIVDKNGGKLDQATQRIGFRHVEVVQEPLKEPDQYGGGTTFLFQVNGVRVFIGGEHFCSNWVPGDNLLTTITPERYRAWLTLLRDGNQNMVRLWGGGVYEPDVFYDTCDELGILVWQDFQFACGVYPAHDEFVENVKIEAEESVRRLRNHPSMALFCGNNEDYQQVLQWGGISELPARRIYEETLPEVVSRLTYPEIPYHRGSPYGGKGWDTSDPTIGDVHQWNIWAGKELPWQEYDRMGGRFVSEFGVPSMPDMRTIRYWTGEGKLPPFAQSKIMAQHCKAGAFERRFAILMNENFRLTSDLETHVYNTQILQAEAMGFAYRSWRREWRGHGKEYTAGAIVWQLNDSWPVTSWAIADYFLRPKASYYAIAREMQPITVGIFRTVTKNRPDDRPRQFYEFGAYQSLGARIDIWATNSTLQDVSTRFELRCVDLESDWTHEHREDVILCANRTTEILSIPCPCPPHPLTTADGDPVPTSSHSVVVGARLIRTETGEIVARYADWPQPLKFIDFPDPCLGLDVDGDRVQIRVRKPVKALVLSVDGEEGPEVRWGDNALDVMPHDPQEVRVQHLNGRKVKAAYMGQEKAVVL